MGKSILKILAVGIMCFVLLVACQSSNPAPDPENAGPQTLTGTSKGHNGDITVEVVVENEVITDVKVVSHTETDGLSDPAIEQIPKAIVATNSADVDSVSGATVTSKGIMEAVKVALAGTQGSGDASQEARNQLQTADDVAALIDAGFQKRAEKYAPEVRELSNGVKVQRTPGREDTYHNVIRSNTYYDTYVLDADNRGCGACHTNLEDTVGKLDINEYGEITSYPHTDLHSDFGVEWTAEMCMDCHNFSGVINKNGTFGGLMHAIHRSETFTNMGGDCWSCHYGSDNGMELWDNVKHDLLRGITPMSSDEMNGSFSWDQSRLVNSGDVFTFVCLLEDGAYARHGNQLLGVEPDPEGDGIYDAWEISIDGLIEKPIEMTLSEMLELFPLETRRMTMECEVNAVGGSMISNFEVTGISLKTVLDYAGIKEGATCLSTPYGLIPLEHVDEYGVYLALQIDGKPLTYEEGYPVMLASAIGGANLYYKWVTQLSVTSDEYTIHEGKRDETGEFINKPNIGIFDLREGQIFSLGETINFSGYAHIIDYNITGVELSFDRGKTWVTMDVEDADPAQWVNWYYDWKPEKAGSYLIMARSVSDSGLKTAAPVQIMFNVQ